MLKIEAVFHDVYILSWKCCLRSPKVKIKFRKLDLLSFALFNFVLNKVAFDIFTTFEHGQAIA